MRRELILGNRRASRGATRLYGTRNSCLADYLPLIVLLGGL